MGRWARTPAAGNPFPRNAVQEFRIITNNFKAEYQKSSSAIITAATKSGSNIWTGNIFSVYQNQGLVALDSIQRRDKANPDMTFTEPDYSRVLAGGTIGGPVIRDRLFLFAAYEGNFQNRQGVTRLLGRSRDLARRRAGVRRRAGRHRAVPLAPGLRQAHLQR